MFFCEAVLHHNSVAEHDVVEAAENQRDDVNILGSPCSLVGIAAIG